MGHKILICDDDVNMTKMTQFLLKKDGYEVVTAADGVDLVNLVKRESPGVILLDLALPNKDGYQILQELKADAETAPVPVIVMSGYEKPEYVDGAIQLGAADYVVKPFKADALREKLGKLFNP
ncbi:response regulator [bacterium]|nr:response regulator [bacterium]